jgi:hypothetical protein
MKLKTNFHYFDFKFHKIKNALQLLLVENKIEKIFPSGRLVRILNNIEPDNNFYIKERGIYIVSVQDLKNKTIRKLNVNCDENK